MVPSIGDGVASAFYPRDHIFKDRTASFRNPVGDAVKFVRVLGRKLATDRLLLCTQDIHTEMLAVA
ncbi:hypothetical protein SKA58_10170 [Sphingomonas sp. SKA58]|nr:hypothetical protein SKA58_10170 [Sphingomonas sp. SKA58]